jgi:hypothetical protein
MTLSARLTLRSIAVAIGLILTLAACGSDDTVAETTGPANEPAAADTAPDTAPASTGDASGPGVTTITMSDGTVYAIELSSCDTTSTDSAFLLPDSYDISGRTSDGAIRFYMARAGLSEDFITQIATLEGDFDEGGQNAALLYSDINDSYDLTVDGANVSGTFSLRAIGPTRPHGDEVGVTVDVRC